MGSSREYDGDFVPPKRYFSLPFDEESINFRSIATFKTPEFLNQHSIKGISNHGHYYVEMDLDEDRGRKSIKVEELNGLRDDVFHSPSSGVITN